MLFLLDLFDFHDALSSRESFDKYRHKFGKSSDGALNLSDQLNEGNQCAVCDDVALQTENAPGECGEISDGKAGVDEAGREGGVARFVDDFFMKCVLQVVEPFGSHDSASQRFDDENVLQAFLYG